MAHVQMQPVPSIILEPDLPTMSRNFLFGAFKGKFSRKSIDANDLDQSKSTSPVQPHRTEYSQVPTRRPDRAGMNAFTTPSNEPPPAYSQAGISMNVPSPAYSPAGQSQASFQTAPTTTGNVSDDRYAFLASFDTVFVIDDSGSMAGRSWRECSTALAAIAPICTSFDADGVDLYFLNAPDRPYHHGVKLSSTVNEIFTTVRPQGGTPTGQVLNRILKSYLSKFESSRASTKPLNVIVITDGVPSDDVESVLVRVAKKLDVLDADSWQVGVQFFQVGEEQGAREHLEALDDDLADLGGGCRDIVDTVPFKRDANGNGSALTAGTILKVVLGAVNKRLDRRRNSSPDAPRRGS